MTVLSPRDRASDISSTSNSSIIYKLVDRSLRAAVTGPPGPATSDTVTSHGSYNAILPRFDRDTQRFRVRLSPSGSMPLGLASRGAFMWALNCNGNLI